MNENQHEEIKEKGYQRGVQEFKEKCFAEGCAEGKIEALREKLIRAVQNKFGEISSEASSKIRYIWSSDILDELFNKIFSLDNQDRFERLIHGVMSDKEKFIEQGYFEALQEKRRWILEGKTRGKVKKLQDMIVSGSRKKFGRIELYTEAKIRTRDAWESLEDLYDELFFRNDKNSFTDFVDQTTTMANRFKAEGYEIGLWIGFIREAFRDTNDEGIQSILEQLESAQTREELYSVLKQLIIVDGLEDFEEIEDQILQEKKNYFKK